MPNLTKLDLEEIIQNPEFINTDVTDVDISSSNSPINKEKLKNKELVYIMTDDEIKPYKSGDYILEIVTVSIGTEISHIFPADRYSQEQIELFNEMKGSDLWKVLCYPFGGEYLLEIGTVYQVNLDEEGTYYFKIINNGGEPKLQAVDI